MVTIRPFLQSSSALYSIPSQNRETSFDQSYLNLFKDQKFVCPNCSSYSYTVSKISIQEPRYLAIIHDSFINSSNSSDFLQVNPSFENPMTGNKFSLIASINLPYPNHYNILMKDPYFELGTQKKGYYLHDGLIEQGQILSITTKVFQEVRLILPYIKLHN